MNKQQTGQSKITNRNLVKDDFGSRLLASLRSLCQPVLPQHIGMFAGSLLPYDSWSPPKVPH